MFKAGAGRRECHPDNGEANASFPSRSRLQERIEGRALIATFGSRDAVIPKGSNDVPPTSGSDSFELQELVIRALVDGRHTTVKGNTHTHLDSLYKRTVILPIEAAKTSNLVNKNSYLDGTGLALSP